MLCNVLLRVDLYYEDAGFVSCEVSRELRRVHDEATKLVCELLP